jgi:ABC-2 type transport system permease protein
MIRLIAGFEFRRQFLSPLPWILMAAMQFVMALLFLVFLDNFLTELQPRLSLTPDAPGATDTIITPLLVWGGMLWLGIVPLLTMRSFSEDRQYQRYELLLSSPASITDIVLGKYLGLLLFIATALLPLLITATSLSLATSLDWGKLISGIMGLYLMLTSFAAAGLFISTLTRQPGMAATLTYGLLALLFVLYLSGKSQGAPSPLFVYVSHFGHFLSLASGIVQSKDIIYYLLFMSGFLALTIHRLDWERRKG